MASGQITPPLSVTITRVDHPDDAERGVLLVGAPASPDAPHMVDGAYWGRGATGKRRLSDPEVRRLLITRQAQTAGFETRLRAMAETFELPARERRKGHVYLLAEPLGPVHAQAHNGQEEHLLELVISSVRFRPRFTPTVELLTYRRADPDGIAAASFPPAEPLEKDHYAIQALVADDGRIAVTSSEGTTDPSKFARGHTPTRARSARAATAARPNKRVPADRVHAHDRRSRPAFRTPPDRGMTGRRGSPAIDA